MSSKKGADPSLKDNFHRTPEDLAKSPEIKQIFKDAKGASITVKIKQLLLKNLLTRCVKRYSPSHNSKNKVRCEFRVMKR